MDTALIKGKFARMGARLKIDAARSPDSVIDIGRDRRGEFFAIDRGRETEIQVLDIRPTERHLLLQLVDGDGPRDKHKFLCGHDERHWFVAAVPWGTRSANVSQAMEALKPETVLAAESRAGLKKRERNRRKNRAFVRQGEWFFIPAPRMRVDESTTRRNEPLMRGGGKPHWAEYCFRTGGETVYVNREFPNGLTEAQRAAWQRDNPDRKLHWNAMQRDMEVYVKGTIKHPDHATVRLDGWHRVEMNTEARAQEAWAKASGREAPLMAFLD